MSQSTVTLARPSACARALNMRSERRHASIQIAHLGPPQRRNADSLILLPPSFRLISPAIVPCTTVPFLSSSVTVSPASFMRNLHTQQPHAEGDESQPPVSAAVHSQDRRGESRPEATRCSMPIDAPL